MSSGEVRDPGVPAGQASAPGAEGGAVAPKGERGRGTAPNMLPGRPRRRFGLERIVVRVVATCGIVAIGVLLGAILADNKVQGWIIGLVIAAVSVVLSAILWSSRQM
jgi:hypothetical protein